MSFSRPNENQGKKNPCNLWVKWKSSEQAWSFWDSEKKESGIMDLQGFVVLDNTLCTVSGFNGKKGQNFFSNEVRRREFAGSQPREMRIQCKEKTGEVSEIIKGNYEDIKESMPDSCSYNLSVYCMSNSGVLFNLRLSGCAFGNLASETVSNDDEAVGWFDFEAKFKHLFTSSTFSCTSAYSAGNDSVKFNIPVFTQDHPIDDGMCEQAVSIDKELQDYLDWYMNEDGAGQIINRVQNSDAKDIKDQITRVNTNDQELEFQFNGEVYTLTKEYVANNFIEKRELDADQIDSIMWRRKNGDGVWMNGLELFTEYIKEEEVQDNSVPDFDNIKLTKGSDLGNSPKKSSGGFLANLNSDDEQDDDDEFGGQKLPF